MGKGSNAGKAQKSREKKAARDKKKGQGGGGSKGMASRAAAMNVVCQVCRASFMNVSNRTDLEQHFESKHSKMSFADCFPDHV